MARVIEEDTRSSDYTSLGYYHTLHSDPVALSILVFDSSEPLVLARF